MWVCVCTIDARARSLRFNRTDRFYLLHAPLLRLMRAHHLWASSMFYHFTDFSSTCVCGCLWRWCDVDVPSKHRPFVVSIQNKYCINLHATPRLLFTFEKSMAYEIFALSIFPLQPPFLHLLFSSPLLDRICVYRNWMLIDRQYECIWTFLNRFGTLRSWTCMDIRSLFHVAFPKVRLF